jgi:DNA-binding NarL/FixJ family response regulator
MVVASEQAQVDLTMANLLDPQSYDDHERSLSPREREVAQLVGRGLSNKEVARRLQLSEGTVKLHLHSVFQKLGAKNRYSLILANLRERPVRKSALR